MRIGLRRVARGLQDGSLRLFDVLVHFQQREGFLVVLRGALALLRCLGRMRQPDVHHEELVGHERLAVPQHRFDSGADVRVAELPLLSELEQAIFVHDALPDGLRDATDLDAVPRAPVDALERQESLRFDEAEGAQEAPACVVVEPWKPGHAVALLLLQLLLVSLAHEVGVEGLGEILFRADDAVLRGVDELAPCVPDAGEHSPDSVPGLRKLGMLRALLSPSSFLNGRAQHPGHLPRHGARILRRGSLGEAVAPCGQAQSTGASASLSFFTAWDLSHAGRLRPCVGRVLKLLLEGRRAGRGADGRPPSARLDLEGVHAARSPEGRREDAVPPTALRRRFTRVLVVAGHRELVFRRFHPAASEVSTTAYRPNAPASQHQCRWGRGRGGPRKPGWRPSAAARRCLAKRREHMISHRNSRLGRQVRRPVPDLPYITRIREE
eukprot:scaffold470_cov257-Pinguiococcus_pyrenoidosus.AAC.12